MDSVGKPFDMSLYTYTANNPVNLTDPKGLLISPWHFVITYEAALNSGYSLSGSYKLAWEVMRKDPPPWVKMDKSANEANTHAMRGKIEIALGEYRYQTRGEALAGTNYIIEKGPLSSALHATQDLPGHNLASMEAWGWNWSTVKHVLKDIFDIFWVYKAYQNSINILNARQPCK